LRKEKRDQLEAMRGESAAEAEILQAATLPQAAMEGQEFQGVPPAEVLSKLMSGLADAGTLDNGRRLLTWLLVPENWKKQPEKIQTMALRIYTRLVEVAAGQTIRLAGAGDTTTNEELKELEANLLARMSGIKGNQGIDGQKPRN
jgi:hypothetical protein